jgi:hypothetical protein
VVTVIGRAASCAAAMFPAADVVTVTARAALPPGAAATPDAAVVTVIAALAAPVALPAAAVVTVTGRDASPVTVPDADVVTVIAAVVSPATAAGAAGTGTGTANRSAIGDRRPGGISAGGALAVTAASWNATSTTAHPAVSAPVYPSDSEPPVLFLYCTMQFEWALLFWLFASAVHPPAVETVAPLPLSP